MRDEIEHLLDDNEDMAQLYLTRKWIQNQQSDAVLSETTGLNSIVPIAPHLRRVSSTRSGSFRSNLNDHDVEDLEMLLEAYFVQLDGTRNKILSVSFSILIREENHSESLFYQANLLLFFNMFF